MRLEDIISRMYMFFGTRNPNLTSILKPEVELMVFLRMRSNKIMKNGKNAEFEVRFQTGSRINGVSAHEQ